MFAQFPNQSPLLAMVWTTCSSSVSFLFTLYRIVYRVGTKSYPVSCEHSLCALSICQNWLTTPFPSKNERLTFTENYPAISVKSYMECSLVRTTITLLFQPSRLTLLPVTTFWQEPKTSFNSPVSSSLWPLNWRSEDAFITGLAFIWSNIFTDSNEKKTCLLLCLLCILKFQTLTCRNFWIFYFMSRLTLYKCAVNVCIQR